MASRVFFFSPNLSRLNYAVLRRRMKTEEAGSDSYTKANY